MFLFVGMDLLEGIVTGPAYNDQKMLRAKKWKLVFQKAFRLEIQAFIEKGLPKSSQKGFL